MANKRKRDSFKTMKYVNSSAESTKKEGKLSEYCTRCFALLSMQRGFDSGRNYWVCKGCGQMLINPDIETESDIVWCCDQCGEPMNDQPGFDETLGQWKCIFCGYENKLDQREIYVTEEEFLAEKNNPYKGMTDDEVLMLSVYTDEEPLAGRDDISLVYNRERDLVYVKKFLRIYDKSLYQYLKEHPVAHMPRIEELYEGDNGLIVIEEYIHGVTLEELLKDKLISPKHAIYIVKRICEILDSLHHLPTPIVHRDVKPSNIILSFDAEVYLLDMNAAKWYKPDQSEDTRYLGTRNYAAPEQVGYGMTGSCVKSDIYAVGMLLNVMLTGTFPKEKKASGKIWDVIERCIRLDADQRFTAREVIEALEALDVTEVIEE